MIGIQKMRLGRKNWCIFFKHSRKIQDTVWPVGIETRVLIGTDEFFCRETEPIKIDVIKFLVLCVREVSRSSGERERGEGEKGRGRGEGERGGERRERGEEKEGKGWERR